MLLAAILDATTAAPGMSAVEAEPETLTSVAVASDAPLLVSGAVHYPTGGKDDAKRARSPTPGRMGSADLVTAGLTAEEARDYDSVTAVFRGGPMESILKEIRPQLPKLILEGTVVFRRHSVGQAPGAALGLSLEADVDRAGFRATVCRYPKNISIHVSAPTGGAELWRVLTTR